MFFFLILNIRYLKKKKKIPNFYFILPSDKLCSCDGGEKWMAVEFSVVLVEGVSIEWSCHTSSFKKILIYISISVYTIN